MSQQRETRSQMIEWLIKWRQDRKGSVSPENHRKYLSTFTTREVRRIVEQIRSQEGGEDQA